METLITITWPSWLVVRAKDRLVLNQYTCQTERKNLNRTGEKKNTTKYSHNKIISKFIKKQTTNKKPKQTSMQNETNKHLLLFDHVSLAHKRDYR